jgi:5-methylcytosine-specific restriction endonuclease McrA
MQEGKKCSRCGEQKDLSSFYFLKRGRYSELCRACNSKRNAERPKNEDVKARAKEAQERFRAKKASAKSYSSAITICSCEQCGKKWSSIGKEVKRFCNRLCGLEYKRLQRIGKPLKLVEREYKCRCCGEALMNTKAGRCDKCKEAAKNTAKKANKKKRKAALRTVAIHSVVDTKVFARDKWRCCECKCRVQKKDIYADNAAELDHIVPVSLGGPHSYSNVQTLCRDCNQKKSNNYNGQLVLAL